jgi:hypothetical protein
LVAVGSGDVDVIVTFVYTVSENALVAYDVPSVAVSVKFTGEEKPAGAVPPSAPVGLSDNQAGNEPPVSVQT